MAKELNPKMVINASILLGVEPAALQAIIQVESAGKPYLPDGRPVILFEGHVFWQQLRALGISESILTKVSEQNPSILYKKWTKQFYSKKREDEYERLDKACSIAITTCFEAEINPTKDCAYASASYGAFQIMGFHYRSLGYSSAEKMYEAMYDMDNQILALTSFLNMNNITPHLKNKNWKQVAKMYNGSGYAANQYDVKLANAYKKALSTFA